MNQRVGRRAGRQTGRDRDRDVKCGKYTETFLWRFIFIIPCIYECYIRKTNKQFKR